MNMQHLTGLLVIAATLSGCWGNAGPAMSNVTGLVQMDGKPIEKGTIQMLPVDGIGSAVTSEIQDGKYSLKIVPGRKRVEVHVSEMKGQIAARPGEADSPMIDIIEEAVSPEFNLDSKLEAMVALPASELNFETKRIPPGTKPRRTSSTPRAH
jgi:hypothetical protein